MLSTISLVPVMVGLVVAAPMSSQEDNMQVVWDDNSMMPIIWRGEESHVRPTYLPPPGNMQEGRLPEDYFFLPISSSSLTSQCVYPCTLQTTSEFEERAAMPYTGDSTGAYSQQDDKVVVIHEHHHHHHHKNVTDDGEEYDQMDEEPLEEQHDETWPTEYRNEASESQQHISKEAVIQEDNQKTKFFKNFFYKFYETLRKKAALKRLQIKHEEKKYYVSAESKLETSGETGLNNEDYKPIQVHMVETDPFIDEGFELIPEYELD